MTNSTKRFLVTGATGQLGSYVVRELQKQGMPITAWSQAPNATVLDTPCKSVDLREPELVRTAFAEAAPEIVIHTAAMSSVGECFRDPAKARQTNTNGTRLLSDLAEQHSVRLVYVSTDLVFDGRRQFYRETDCPTPLSVYGHTKAAAERPILNHSGQLVVRISLLFGPSINGRPSFFDKTVEAIRSGSSVTLFEDEWRTPLSLLTAAQGLIEASRSEASGIMHLGGQDRMTRLDMGQRLARLLDKDASILQAASREALPASEPRPRDTSLDTQVWHTTFPSFPRTGYEDAIRELGLVV